MKKAETALQMRIQHAIERLGGVVYKNHGSMITEPGIPDLFVCYKGYFFAIEVKMPEDGDLSEAQKIHLRNLKKAGAKCAVIVSPEDAELFLKDPLGFSDFLQGSYKWE